MKRKRHHKNNKITLAYHMAQINVTLPRNNEATKLEQEDIELIGKRTLKRSEFAKGIQAKYLKPTLKEDTYLRLNYLKNKPDEEEENREKSQRYTIYNILNQNNRILHIYFKQIFSKLKNDTHYFQDQFENNELEFQLKHIDSLVKLGATYPSSFLEHIWPIYNLFGKFRKMEPQTITSLQKFHAIYEMFEEKHLEKLLTPKFTNLISQTVIKSPQEFQKFTSLNFINNMQDIVSVTERLQPLVHIDKTHLHEISKLYNNFNKTLYVQEEKRSYIKPFSIKNWYTYNKQYIEKIQKIINEDQGQYKLEYVHQLVKLGNRYPSSFYESFYPIYENLSKMNMRNIQTDIHLNRINILEDKLERIKEQNKEHFNSLAFIFSRWSAGRMGGNRLLMNFLADFYQRKSMYYSDSLYENIKDIGYMTPLVYLFSEGSRKNMSYETVQFLKTTEMPLIYKTSVIQKEPEKSLQDDFDIEFKKVNVKQTETKHIIYEREEPAQIPVVNDQKVINQITNKVYKQIENKLRMQRLKSGL